MHRFAILFVLTVLFCAVGSSYSATIHVPSQQPTIQAGINAAVNGDIEWSTSYPLPNHESGIALTEAYDGGVAVVSEVTPFGTGEKWTHIARYTAMGDTLWTRLLSLSRLERPKCIVQTPDSGFCVVGFSDSLGSERSFVTALRISSQGELIWAKEIASLGRYLRVWDAVLADDGFIYAAGVSNLNDAGGYRVLVVKMDLDGDTAWVRTTGNYGDEAYSILMGPTGHLIVSGTESLQKTVFLEMDSSATVIRRRVYDEYSQEKGHSVIPNNSGGYSIFGYAFTGTADYAPYIISVDSGGEKQWSSIGSGYSTINPHRSGCIAHENGFLYLTSRQLPSGKWSSQIGKYQTNGQDVWRIDLDSNRESTMYDIVPSSDSGYYLLGWSLVPGATTSDTWVIKLRSTNSQPSAPIQLSPTELSTASNTPILWIQNGIDIDNDPLTYEFAGFHDTDCVAGPAIDLTGVAQTSDSTGGQIVDPLAENCRYWWRARAFDGYEYSAWTSYAQFMVNGAPEAPSAPMLDYPPLPDNKPIFTLLPTLSWQNSYDPDPGDTVRYKLELSDRANFSFALVRDSLLNTNLPLTDSLVFGTHYYWRVTAKDKTGLSAISGVKEFWTWKLGDMNHSHSTDLSDLSLLIAYLTQTPRPDISPKMVGDLTGNCKIDLSDLSTLIAFMTTSGVQLQVGCE